MGSKIDFYDPNQSLKKSSFETLFRNSAQCVSAGLPVRGSFYQMKKQNVGHQKK